jgi:uncharacterized protein YceH (UPF0502 family)
VPAEADAVEIRVVACLVEKQRTTPDVYPLSLNALRLACNQSTNRDPVVDYDEQTVSDALRRTALRGWTRLTSGAGSRARKYRHLLPEALSVDDAEVNILAVLMLRGAQTPGELKQRTERYSGGFADLAAVNEVLERLIGRGFVIRHPRRPGQKEERYEQVLGGDDAVELVPAEPRSTLGPADEPRSTLGPEDGPSDDRDAGAGPNDDRPAPAQPSVADETARLDRLEADLLDLKGEITKLREALGE